MPGELPRPPQAQSPLFMLDYDGTLAEIVAEPSEAFAHPRAAGLLRALADRHPLYLITGRRIADLQPLLDVPGLSAIGVHGSERGPLGGEVHATAGPAALTALESVRAKLPELPGLRVEDKGSAIALHYRGLEEEQAASTLSAWAETLPEGLDALWGKQVLELRPAGTDKGRIARQLAGEHPGDTPVFIGDDTTDEDAFRALDDGITIKVGPGSTAARYRLPGVDAVIGYLEAYL